MALSFLSCTWIAGLILGTGASISPWLLLTGVLPLPLLFTRWRRLAVLLSLALLVFIGGTVYAHHPPPTPFQGLTGEEQVAIRGLVDRDPEPRDRFTAVHLSLRELKMGEVWRETSGEATLIVPRYPTYRYGDLLQATGKPEPASGGNPGSDITPTLPFPGVQVLAQSQGNVFLQWVYTLREHLAEALGSVLPEPQASLAQGLVLGLRGDIPLEVRQEFARTGTAHLLAISGVNLSIVAGILLSLAGWLLGRRYGVYIWISLATIWLYAILTGGSAPVLRAAIMASLFLATELLGRQRNAAPAFFFTAALMAVVSPAILREASFQMSFAAIGGLIFIYPRLEPLCRIPSGTGENDSPIACASRPVMDGLGVSIAATLAVWPLIAHYFGTISPVGPVATLLTMPAVPAAIGTGLLASAAGLVFLPAAQLLGWLVWVPLSFILVVVSLSDRIPALEGRALGTMWVMAYYAVLALALWLTGNRARMVAIAGTFRSLFARLPAKWAIPPLAVLATLATIAAATMPDGNLHVSILDVGQGDAVLIQKGNQQILVDGGPSPGAINAALSREMPFWDRTIDLVVLTHPHADHLTGLIPVLDRYRVRQVLYPDSACESPLCDEWRRAIEGKGVRKVIARTGQRISMGGVVLDVLGTGAASPGADDSSLVLRVGMGSVSFLLTGDTSLEGERPLMGQNLSSTVLKVSHHGSAEGTSSTFLSAVSPRVAVISVGEGNRFGHPSSETLKRLAARRIENIYRTDRNGTVEFITDGTRLWVEIER